MTTLKMNADNRDLDLSSGNLILVTGILEVRQKIITRLRFFLGEWFLDTRLGFPYFERVLGVKATLVEAEQLFRQVILSTPGVIEVLSFTTSFDNVSRAYSLGFKARSTDGVITVGDLAFVVG